MVFCYVIIHITYMQCKVAIWRVIKCATLMGNSVIGKGMQVIKSVFIRKFCTQHNVLVHSTNYLCNENAQYLSLLKRIKIKNPVDQELIHHGLRAEEVGYALCAAKK